MVPPDAHSAAYLVVSSPLGDGQLRYWREAGYTGGFIYFVQGCRWPTVKIGYAVDPSTRLRELQTGNADRLRLLFVAPGTQRDEARTHRRFAEARRSGEWFAGPFLPVVLAYAEAISGYLIAVHDGSPEAPPFPVAGTVRTAADVREIRRAIEGWAADGQSWPGLLEIARTRFPDWTPEELREQRDQMKRSTLYNVKLRSVGPQPLMFARWGTKEDLEHRHYDPWAHEEGN